ncbi:MAG TPA: hypothetical protein ENG87_03065 [Candidatus Pacearchaeota archaeon]|nr:hypothetical protein BMS3Abin17_00150 [archaeon BMS3Abin17]HDK42333.1 hypothetical protein [Candidatus Pacearchaeota archaeon]HDZ60297.1 hypothetical protein [Candidatus Pacearchaeota archaeon]
MDREKLIVVLLLVAIVLSVASVLITSNLSVDELENATTPNIVPDEDNGAASVSLVVQPNPAGGAE